MGIEAWERTCSLSNTRVGDQRALDLRGGETMARNIDDIVHASFDPDVAILIPSSSITSEVEAGVWLQ